MGSALPRVGIPSSAELYDAALEGFVRVNEVIMRRNPGTFVPVYQSGAKYALHPHDYFRHCHDVDREDWGDCEDLSTYRAAELRVSGEDPAARVVTYKTGRHQYHAVVMRGDGFIEDPSVILGMKVRNPARYVAKIEAAFGVGAADKIEVPHMARAIIGVVNDPNPNMANITFDVYRRANGGWAGVVRVPLAKGVIPTGTPSAMVNAPPGTANPLPPQAIVMQTSTSANQSKAAAVSKAMNLAKAVADNPAVKALIPPQAAAALEVIKSPQAQAAAKAAISAGKSVASAIRKLF